MAEREAAPLQARSGTSCSYCDQPSTANELLPDVLLLLDTTYRRAP